jgi:carboxymethylenebutenolidase
VLVLPEVFGINGWVRSIADRLAAEGYAALAVPLFTRTAPALELGYSADELAEGRSHKERTTAGQLLVDLSQAVAWLGPGPLGCVGFCFGGHVAWLAATLPAVDATCSFYGAGVATGRPGGGPPTLEVLPEIRGRLLCICGTEDPLIPPRDRAAIGTAIAAENDRRASLLPATPAHRLLLLPAGHGFLCEAREDFRPGAAAQGWREFLALLEAAF